MDNHQDEALIPVGVGNIQAQQRFIEGHQQYLAELPNLIELCNKVFNRALAQPNDDERQVLLDASVPNDDPAVVAWEDRVTAGNLIFHFGLMACDDFNAIAILGGNGAGFAAFIILRSMYERLVTAMYIAKKPSEARHFAESSPIHKLKYLNRLLDWLPELKARYDDPFMDQVRKEAEASKAKRKQSSCSKCNQPITDEAWTRLRLDAMAREVDPKLAEWYGPIYLEGTNQSHANSLGMERRLEETESGYRYKSPPENEASMAIRFAHRLLLRLIDMQNGYFSLGHEQEIGERFKAYDTIWGQA